MTKVLGSTNDLNQKNRKTQQVCGGLRQYTFFMFPCTNQEVQSMLLLTVHTFPQSSVSKK